MIKALADPVSGEGSFPVLQMTVFLLCPHMEVTATSSLWGIFYQGTNPSYGGSTLMT